MTASRALIWLRPGAGDPGAAYCQHAGLGALDPLAADSALAALESDPARRGDLIVVIASRDPPSPHDEALVRGRGIGGDRIWCYANPALLQFGVSAKGCVGETA